MCQWSANVINWKSSTYKPLDGKTFPNAPRLMRHSAGMNFFFFFNQKKRTQAIRNRKTQRVLQEIREGSRVDFRQKQWLKEKKKCFQVNGTKLEDPELVNERLQARKNHQSTQWFRSQGGELRVDLVKNCGFQWKKLLDCSLHFYCDYESQYPCGDWWFLIQPV